MSGCSCWISVLELRQPPRCLLSWWHPSQYHFRKCKELSSQKFKFIHTSIISDRTLWIRIFIFINIFLQLFTLAYKYPNIMEMVLIIISPFFSFFLFFPLKLQRTILTALHEKSLRSSHLGRGICSSYLKLSLPEGIAFLAL